MKNVEQEVKSWIEKKIIYIAFIVFIAYNLFMSCTIFTNMSAFNYLFCTIFMSI